MTGKRSPWGIINRADMLADGIVGVGTPSHGGIHLDHAHSRRLKAMLGPEFRSDRGGMTWWEEDCDWAIPFFVFQDEIRTAGLLSNVDETVVAARKTIERYYPENAETILSQKETAR